MTSYDNDETNCRVRALSAALERANEKVSNLERELRDAKGILLAERIDNGTNYLNDANLKINHAGVRLKGINGDDV